MRPKARSRSVSSLAGVLLCALWGSAARAELSPPAQSDLSIQDLSVVGEDGAATRLRALTDGRPALLLPVFASCAGSCPITTESLRNALSSHPETFRVVVLSFDPKDLPRDLAAFRARHGLPAAWTLVRGADAAATRAFLDQFGFRLMTEPGGFDHPDETFVLSPKGVWAGTLSGPSFPASELESARRRALSADAPTAAERLSRPGIWIPAAFAALLLCAGTIFSLVGKRA